MKFVFMNQINQENNIEVNLDKYYGDGDGAHHVYDDVHHYFFLLKVPGDHQHHSSFGY